MRVRGDRRWRAGHGPSGGVASRLATLVALSVLLAGCVRGCTSSRPPIHLNPNMDDQPRATALAASDFFYDGKAMRSPIPGTVARQDAVEPGAFESGRDGAGGGFVTAIPPAAAAAFGERLAVRGAERYAIYCAACHGDEGDGQGMLFHRSAVTSADLRIPRLVDMPDGQLYDVITNGFGLMPPYRAQVPVADRWAIVAYVRQLQADSPVAAHVGASPQPGVDGEAGVAPADGVGRPPAAGEVPGAASPAAPDAGGAP